MRRLPEDGVSRGRSRPTVGLLERIVVRARVTSDFGHERLLHVHVFAAGHTSMLTMRGRPSETRSISSKRATEFKVVIYRKIAATHFASAWLAPGLTM
jgi:hypothetical protein